MKLFNNRSGLRDLPCFAEGIYWATGLSLTTPFTEGCPGVNNKASPPGRHQEHAPKQRCTFSSTTFSSVQFSLMLVGVWLGLHWVLFYFFDHYIKFGEVIGFRLFRATGLAFAIRPKDGVAIYYEW